ncbi:MAG TPA: hypothetical protein VJ724_06525 [Tahibacter sp.]|nr:hypothetical protein [Tahibacter sp.]
MSTVTVLFEETVEPQQELGDELMRVVGRMEKQGLAREFAVRPVFPGEEDDELKGAFLVSFLGAVESVVRELNALPGIEKAYITPNRGRF